MAGRDSDGSVSPPRMPRSVCSCGPLPRGLTTAPSPSPSRSALDPGSAPRILLRGECSSAPAGPSEALAPLPRDGQMRDSRRQDPPSASTGDSAPVGASHQIHHRRPVPGK
ncbi:hypothetical protein ZWY2020_001182 [Hordeum vulgare]|nr:hypothetical protein ZWY2020_001182 [Hordeum vulgare]